MSRFLNGAILAAAVAATAPALGQLFEAHYLFRGGYPPLAPAWIVDIEGVAHDDDAWFFTTSGVFDIKKVPARVRLSSENGTARIGG